MPAREPAGRRGERAHDTTDAESAPFRRATTSARMHRPANAAPPASARTGAAAGDVDLPQQPERHDREEEAEGDGVEEPLRDDRPQRPFLVPARGASRNARRTSPLRAGRTLFPM